MEWPAIWVTLRLALGTTAILFVLGLPLAYWIAHTRWRGRFLVEAIVALPLILPPTVLGFYILLATGPHSLLGRTYADLAGYLGFSPRLPFTFSGILLASVLYNLPFAVRPFAAAFAGIDRKLIEASWCLGVSRRATFCRILFPLAWPGILTGLVLTFAHTVGEFGVVLMVGGNIPGRTRTLSMSIYDQYQAQEYAAAHHTALALVGFAFVCLCLTYALQKRVLKI